jgi:hypothetical protein
MAQIISLTVAMADGTRVDPNVTKAFVVPDIRNIFLAVSAGSYQIGNVNSLVYADTGFGVKGYYVTETPTQIETEANA